jgi:hypothetical protein
MTYTRTIHNDTTIDIPPATEHDRRFLNRAKEMYG